MANPSLQMIPPWALPRYKLNPWQTPGINPNAPMPSYPGSPVMPSAPVPLPTNGQGPGWLQKFTGGVDRLLGGLGGNITDPNLTPQEQDASKQRQRMAMAAALLQASGPTPKGTQGLLQPFGYAMQAGQQAADQYSAEALRGKLLQAQIQKAQDPGRLIGSASPSDFTPESLAKYQQSGNPADLVPVEKNTLNRVNPRDYTPESLARYMQSGNLGDLERIAPYQAVNTPGGGVNRFDPISGKVTPTDYTPQQATNEAALRKQLESEYAARGEAFGKAQGALLDKAFKGQQIGDILDLAEPLIDSATGSLAGAGRDKLAAVFGFAPEGAQAIAQLKILQASLMLNQPRMEGPQSDKDVQLYREAAAQLGDPAVPHAVKQAAIKTIRQLYQKYGEAAGIDRSSELPDISQAPNAAPKGEHNWNDL